ncbi:MAG: hypothetical protein DCC88_00285 [Spirobacillus cienkowskii]|uniref:Uncharacterized protein n=1 Tax=Spirobacillus cienkowskii TaxID=495820 RepID=A0A369KUF7_9BACT|nr:MAG: hypothetical protein DCC88_00285 [Spirobacillus cienkowskii]
MPYTIDIGKAIYKKNLMSSLNMKDSDANQQMLDKQAEAFAKAIQEILPLILVQVPSAGLVAPNGAVAGLAIGKLS